MKAKRHVYNMGIIGNCSYIAYIDTFANVKWLCLPRFDSSFIFGSLLDDDKGGLYSVMPVEKTFQSEQHYIKNTNILVTEFQSESGHFSVTDFAPRFFQYDRHYKPLMFIRRIKRMSGNPIIEVKCRPVGNYGEVVPEIVRGSNHIRFLNLNSQVRLSSDIPLNYILDEKSFVLEETRYLIFTYGEPLEAPIRETAENFLDKTRRYWQDWVKATSIPPIFQEQIIRSALVLKLNQYEDTGGIIAAGTTSLPEHDQSGRTWDYRYCWMRDTYYSLNALNSLGHFEEVEKYFSFIQNIILEAQTRISPMYSVTGQQVPAVSSLPLHGYLGNQPVRIGNDASFQIQNDVYGQVLVSLLPLFVDDRLNYFDHERTLSIVTWLLKKIADTLEEPDSGLWEFNNITQLHCYTMLFHWAGGHSAYRIANLLGDKKLMATAAYIITKSAVMIEKCYDHTRNVYTQAIGTPHLDATGLQLITMNYLDPNSRRTKLHLAAMEKDLKTPDGLFYRYNIDDFGKPQTSFLMCAFWYAEALACVGRVEEGYDLLTRLSSYSNHLGLFSEDADFNGGQWGNFPQAYSHVGFMNAVYRISVKQDRPFFIDHSYHEPK